MAEREASRIDSDCTQLSRLTVTCFPRRRIRKTLAATKFYDAPIVGVAARPGGAASAGEDTEAVESIGVKELVEVIKGHIKLPERAPDGPFMFAVDHCFPIKGQGTVLTGTVLSGSVKVGQEVELPELKLTRKVRPMKPSDETDEADF